MTISCGLCLEEETIASRNNGWTVCGGNVSVRNTGEALASHIQELCTGEPLSRDCTCVAFSCLQGPVKKDPKCTITPSLLASSETQEIEEEVGMPRAECPEQGKGAL